MPPLKLGKRSNIKEKAEESHGQNPGEMSHLQLHIIPSSPETVFEGNSLS